MTEQLQILYRRLECISRDLMYSGQPKKCFQCIQEETVVGCPPDKRNIAAAALDNQVSQSLRNHRNRYNFFVLTNMVDYIKEVQVSIQAWWGLESRDAYISRRQPVPGSQIVGKTRKKKAREVLFSRFALSQFSGPDYLGAWNRLSLRIQPFSLTQEVASQKDSGDGCICWLSVHMCNL